VRGKVCYNCGALWEGVGNPHFRERCAQCGVELHCCLNCRYYEGRCRNPDGDTVIDVRRGNFCEEFMMREVDLPCQEERERARDAWKRLWGDE